MIGDEKLYISCTFTINHTYSLWNHKLIILWSFLLRRRQSKYWLLNSMKYKVIFQFFISFLLLVLFIECDSNLWMSGFFWFEIYFYWILQQQIFLSFSTFDEFLLINLQFWIFSKIILKSDLLLYPVSSSSTFSFFLSPISKYKHHSNRHFIDLKFLSFPFSLTLLST